MLLEERPAADAVPSAPAAGGGARLRGHGRRAVLLGAAACLALSLLTMLFPSAPTYDPWSWIIWGREIAHLDLNTVEGPSWKPLPVAITTVFSLFGSIAPDLWVIVARAGAIGAVVLAFRVSRRLGGGVAGGLAAALALALAPWWLRTNGMANSEGLMVLFVLGAVDRHLSGDRRGAFLLGVLAALLRPEAWPFLALFGAWAMWRRHLSPALVIGAGVAVLALWILPEWWGSGDPWRAAHRAKDVNVGAPTYADSPVLALLEDAAVMITIPVWIGLGAAGVLAVFTRDRTRPALALLALAWLGLVAYMTKDGFSGNQRYLIVPIALLMVLAGAGIGQLLAAAGRRLTSSHVPRAAAACAVAAVAAGFTLPNVRAVDHALSQVRYQAQLTDALPPVVAAAGGAAFLRACGPAATGPFLVPAVAWNLGVHAEQVQLEPGRPGVAFRERTNPGSRPVPSLRGLEGTPAPRTLAANKLWRIVAVCGDDAGPAS